MQILETEGMKDFRTLTKELVGTCQKKPLEPIVEPPIPDIMADFQSDTAQQTTEERIKWVRQQFGSLPK